ncbi:type 1 glutamine amidotransferase [Marmoricola sp. URHB0036]|uniref:type 1 glutamine amidotransferase n=1 Tax=Marmoricola sp. URHB0036 TaxID=1298863 RepID=UPI0003FAEE75|nr:type 1 glutamine amidotransferase [Marmoricola sp. URHB0036]
MAARVLVVQHQDDCPPALVGQWLVEAGCALDVRRPYAGDQLPDDLTGHDAFLVLGGSMGADDDAEHPWLTATKALIRDAADRGTPTLGICLGHQLAASALGGEVARNPHGQQLGLLPMGWTAAAPRDELTAGLVEAGVGIHWNDDIVTRAPDGTETLATAPGGELQVARFATRVWGVQLHPEVDEQILATWAEEDPDRYAEGVLDDVLSRIVAARAQLEAGWRPLATALATLAQNLLHNEYLI